MIKSPFSKELQLKIDKHREAGKQLLQLANSIKKSNELDFVEGDIIRNLGSGDAYVVISRCPLVAVRTVHPSNPSEWVKVYSSDRTENMKTK